LAVEEITNEEETTTTTADNGVTLSPPPPPPQAVEMMSKTVRSYGQEFTIEFPSSHRLHHRDHVQRWKNDSETLARIRAKVQSSKYATDDPFAQSLWAIAMSCVPALALSAAQYLVPLIVMAFFHDTGLFKYGTFDRDEYATSFPSDWYLRKMTQHQAARDTISMSKRLATKKIYMSCDKGNKKGIGHFVKVLSDWDDENGVVNTQVLDIDASGGKDDECALAIQASMNKLKVEDDSDTHLLYGHTTDSGGGGVLENLGNSMRRLPNLCAPRRNYKIANCTIHAINLQLSNAVKQALGEGSLEKINASQLLHTVYRMQESLDGDEWRHMLYKACEFVHNFNAEEASALPPLDSKAKAQLKNERAFIDDFLIVYQFGHLFKKGVAIDPSEIIKYEDTIYGKMTAPILTRWWTVGSAASYTFDYCLQVFHACQQVINIYKSTSTPNGIASDLYAMMKDQENFIDVALIRSFNKAYINPHLDWLQSGDDLSGSLGFQAHNIVARYYLMREDLKQTMTNPSMKQYMALVNKVPDDGSGNRARHLKKSEVFYIEASESLDKHFRRWLKADLLPAALLSEGPTAQVVAACMLDKPLPSFNNQAAVTYMASADWYKFKSDAHKRPRFNLNLFHKWLKNQLIDVRKTDNGEYSHQDWTAATLISNDVVVDLRSKDYTAAHGEIRLFMHRTYLPLASQSQFVESVVKEAKLAASTDRSEQVRSCYAIIRSPTPLGKADKHANAEKIKAVIDSALERSMAHAYWKRRQLGMQYDAHFNQILYCLTKQGHSAQYRTETKKTQVDAIGVKFKKQNKHQQTKQQHLMPAVTGSIPFGKLFGTKANHMEDLKTELLFRDVPQEEIPESITGIKDMLRLHELERLQWEEDMTEAEATSQSQKNFKRLSKAAFKMD